VEEEKDIDVRRDPMFYQLIKPSKHYTVLSVRSVQIRVV